MYLVCTRIFPLIFILSHNSAVRAAEVKVFYIMVPYKSNLDLGVAYLLKFIQWYTKIGTLWESHLFTHLTLLVELDSCNGIDVLVELHGFSAYSCLCSWPVCGNHMYVSIVNINFIFATLLWYTTSLLFLIWHFLPDLSCFSCCDLHTVVVSIYFNS